MKKDLTQKWSRGHPGKAARAVQCALSTTIRSGQFSGSGLEPHSCQCPGYKPQEIDSHMRNRNRHPNATLFIHNKRLNFHMDQKAHIGIISAFSP